MEADRTIVVTDSAAAFESAPADLSPWYAFTAIQPSVELTDKYLQRP